MHEVVRDGGHVLTVTGFTKAHHDDCAKLRPRVSHFWANIPQIPTCRNLLTSEIPQMCDPILVTLLAPFGFLSLQRKTTSFHLLLM